MQDINYLEVQWESSRSLPIPMGFASGTGMLVGHRLLLTNNHVLRSLFLAK